MDLSSILSTTAKVIKGIHNNTALIKHAPKSCESLKAELLSIQEILAELDNLIKADDGDVRYFTSDGSHHVELTSD